MSDGFYEANVSADNSDIYRALTPLSIVAFSVKHNNVDCYFQLIQGDCSLFYVFINSSTFSQTPLGLSGRLIIVIWRNVGELI